MNFKYSFILPLTLAPILTHAALGPIVITPTLYEQPIEDVITPITIITEQDIHESAATNVADLLRGQAGLNVRDLFGDGNQASIDLRGFGPRASSSTLILINGRKLNNSSDLGAPDLSTINIDQIKQIEILQGSAGVLYGNQAIGGVINIILKEITNNSSAVSATLGSFNSQSLKLNVNRVFGKSSLSIFATNNSSDNFRDNNDTDKTHFSLRAQHVHDSFTGFVEIETTDDHLDSSGALLQTEVDDDRTQSLSFYSNDYFDTQTDILRFGFDKPIDANQSISLDISTRKNDREFLQTFRPTPATVVTTQDRESKNLNLVYKRALKNLTFSPFFIAGFNHEDNNYKLVSSLGPQPLKQKITDLYISSDFSINNESTFNIGLRNSQQKANNNANKLDDDQNVLSASYSWKRDEVKAYFRADQNYRFPTVEEHTGVAFGEDVGLKTQTGISYEAGAEINVGQNKYRMTMYQIDLENEIAFDGTIFANLNLDDTSRKGMILEATNIWNNQFKTQLSVTLLDAKTTDGTYNGKTLPLVAEKSVRLSGTYQYNTNITSHMELINVGEQVLGGDFDNALAKLKSYQVVNANIIYKQKQWDLSFRINNLLDEKYSETGNQFSDFSAFPAVTNFESFFTAPDRNYWITVKFKF